jgi:hypothetical protein
MMWDMKPSGEVSYNDRHEIVLHAGRPRVGFASKKRQALMEYPTSSGPTQTATAGMREQSAGEDAQEDIVMYRDLFNASWEEYRT